MSSERYSMRIQIINRILFGQNSIISDCFSIRSRWKHAIYISADFLNGLSLCIPGIFSIRCPSPEDCSFRDIHQTAWIKQDLFHVVILFNIHIGDLSFTIHKDNMKARIICTFFCHNCINRKTISCKRKSCYGIILCIKCSRYIFFIGFARMMNQVEFLTLIQLQCSR